MKNPKRKSEIILKCWSVANYLLLCFDCISRQWRETKPPFFFLVTNTRIAFNVENFTFFHEQYGKMPITITHWSLLFGQHALYFIALNFLNIWINALYYCHYCVVCNTKLYNNGIAKFSGPLHLIQFHLLFFLNWCTCSFRNSILFCASLRDVFFIAPIALVDNEIKSTAFERNLYLNKSFEFLSWRLQQEKKSIARVWAVLTFHNYVANVLHWLFVNAMLFRKWHKKHPM